MDEEIRALLDRQDGVISRRQAVAAGVRPHELRRLVRRREWARVHDGVFVDHTGRLTWRQRAWAAILWAWPAALWGESALTAADPSPDARAAIHVVVARHRSGLRPPEGVVVHFAERFDSVVFWNLSPPRVRLEEAALDAAIGAGSDLEAVAVLAHWIQRRRTTARRLRSALAERRRVPRRDWLESVLADLAAGTCSVLEHGFLVNVERPHGLPRADRQRAARSSQGLVYRDADYGPLLIELDGRLFHDSAAARDRDLERDLDAAVELRASLRLGWGQVFTRPCTTAAKLVAVMRHHGLAVNPSPCGPDCRLTEQRRDLEPPGGTPARR